jgi:hypothetical protein
MRLVGTVSVIAGVGLCISVVWAAIGFTVMLFGLICLLIDDEKTKRARKLAPSAILKAEPSKTRASETLNFQAEAREQTPPPLLFPPPSALPAANDGLILTPERNAEQKLIWKTLCANDPDVAHGAAMLTPYAKQYVDDFAKGYLLSNDKEFLATTARQNFGLETFAEPGFETATARPSAEPAAQKLHAKSGPVLHVIQRAEPNRPAEIAPKVAREPVLISIERGPGAVGDPPRHGSQKADLRQLAVISEKDTHDDRAVSTDQPAAAGTVGAGDDLFDELRRLKATSKGTAVKTISAKTTILKNAATSAPQRDRGLRVVTDVEVGATPLRVAASSPMIKNDDRQFDDSPAVQRAAQLEEKVQESIAIKIVDGTAKRQVLTDEQDDADNFRLLLGKLV